MKRLNGALLLSLTVAGLMFGPAANAQDTNFTFTLGTTALQVTTSGGQVTFDGAVTNGDAYQLYLNSDSSGFDTQPQPTNTYPPLTLDDTYFNGFPLSLTPSGNAGDSYGVSQPQALFTVTVPAGTPVGSYNGYFTIVGGSDSSYIDPITNQLGTAEFTVDVTSAVPEGGASSLYLLLAGVVCFGVMVLRARKARKASASA
jgi:hypothetical protein